MLASLVVHWPLGDLPNFIHDLRETSGLVVSRSVQWQKKASGCQLCANVIMFGGLDHFLFLLSGKSLAAYEFDLGRNTRPWLGFGGLLGKSACY